MQRDGYNPHGIVPPPFVNQGLHHVSPYEEGPSEPDRPLDAFHPLAASRCLGLTFECAEKTLVIKRNIVSWMT